ncbi:hypothetical protein JCM19992_19110 [Thermostilla marina]
MILGCAIVARRSRVARGGKVFLVATLRVREYARRDGHFDSQYEDCAGDVDYYTIRKHLRTAAQPECTVMFLGLIAELMP